VLESPDLLRQWDLPGSEYAVGPKQLESIVALVDATPDYLSQRMRWLELALPPKDKTILTCQPTALRRKIERHPGIDRVAIWTQPYEVELLRTKIDQYPQLTNLLNRDLAPLNPPWPLAYARGQHIRGIFRDPDYQEGAKELYLKVRLSDAQIRQIRTPPGMQRLLESMLGETYAIPTEPAQFQSMMQATRELLVALRSYASLWLGQIAFETQDYDTAREFFQNRVLADESNKSWRWGATYCLARCQEALGRAQRDPDLIRQALATYRSDSDSPQASGNRLRAQQLEKWLAAESSLIRVNE
jgi:tetratricopeptide (TPR) repeat protein